MFRNCKHAHQPGSKLITLRQPHAGILRAARHLEISVTSGRSTPRRPAPQSRIAEHHPGHGNDRGAVPDPARRRLGPAALSCRDNPPQPQPTQQRNANDHHHRVRPPRRAQPTPKQVVRHPGTAACRAVQPGKSVHNTSGKQARPLLGIVVADPAGSGESTDGDQQWRDRRRLVTTRLRRRDKGETFIHIA